MDRTTTGAGVLSGLILWWWAAFPEMHAGHWPPMTEVAAGMHGVALWWLGARCVEAITRRWGRPSAS